MHGKDLLVNDCCDRQTIEAVGKCFPQFDVVASLALIVETVNTVDRSTFMISSENEEILRVLDFVRKKQAYRLQGLFSTVNIISEE